MVSDFFTKSGLSFIWAGITLFAIVGSLLIQHCGVHVTSYFIYKHALFEALFYLRSSSVVVL